jgi:hypothetical protein
MDPSAALTGGPVFASCAESYDHWASMGSAPAESWWGSPPAYCGDAGAETGRSFDPLADGVSAVATTLPAGAASHAGACNWFCPPLCNATGMWTIRRPASKPGVPTTTGLIGPHATVRIGVTTTCASPLIANSNVAHPVLMMGGGTARESADDNSADRP